VTEQQPYRVVQTYPDFELREYPAYLVAETTVNASFEDAGNRAFNALLQYINGANRSQRKLAMTAPVIQGEQLAMTAPVIQTSTEPESYTVAFVLAAHVTPDEAPMPTDQRVLVRQVPAGFAAVMRYSGRWSQASYDEHVHRLQAALTAAGLQAISSPRFARFDPPFKPWFLRRNEVVIDVATTSSS
jgi:hypothetical protein